jgi:hypothetical protein
LAGSNIRISELLALQVEKHISDDRSPLFIRQQRRNEKELLRDFDRLLRDLVIDWGAAPLALEIGQD